MIMVYLVDRHPEYWEKVAEILDEAKMIIFSTLLFGEVLAGIYRDGDKTGEEAFLEFVHASQKISIIPFTMEIALKFAKLRGLEHPLPPADCIHLATAMEAKADLFLTNDKKIKSLPGLKVVHLEDLI